MIEFALKLWKLARPYKGRFILGIITGALSGLMETLVLVTAAFVVATAFTHSGASDTPDISRHLPKALQGIFSALQDALSHYAATSHVGLFLLVSLIPIAMTARGIVNYLNNYLMNWVAIRAVCDLRTRLFDHLQSQPLGYLSKLSTPELTSRINDALVLQNMIAVWSVTVIREPVNAITLLFAAIHISWRLALVSVVVLLVCGIPISIFNKKVRHAGAHSQVESAAMFSVMHESFTGNRIVKAYNLEKVMSDRFVRVLRGYTSHYMRIVRATESPGPIIEIIGAIGVAVLLVYLVDSGTSFERASIFIVALLSTYKPIKAIVRVQSQLHQARAATGRLFDMLATPNAMPDPANPVPLTAEGAEIEFDNVTFGYDKRVVLKNFNLRVKPGQVIALVGSTGGGKTTVTNLLLRFYDPTSGAIRIGGIDIRKVSLHNLRDQIAIVTQDVILFNESIANNIAYGRPGASQADIEAAAKAAYAHDFILEKGYNFGVGERGSNLSGGQKQRLAIARAVVKKAPILILDEATSSLDNQSERIVQKALDELMVGRTTFCVAHRLSTVRNADLIVAIEHGQIMEMGRHDELLERGGVYHKLYSLSLATGDGKLHAPPPKPAVATALVVEPKPALT